MLVSKPVCISIPGDFWDSHIYSNWLYLFGVDKSLRKVNWEYLISRQPSFSKAVIVVNSTFVDSSFLYAHESQVFLQDATVREHVKNLISEIQGVRVEISDLDGYSPMYRKDGDSPFPELHADFEIYHRKMYAGMPEGLYAANSGLFDEGKVDKLWDARVYAVKASNNYGAIALAGADDGLWEYDINAAGKRKNLNSIVGSDLTQTTSKYCTACDWADQSVFAWSASSNGFLASFYTEKAAGEKKVNRVFDRAIDSAELSGLAEDGIGVTFWGSHDRAYALRGDVIEVLDYDPKLVTKQKKIEKQIDQGGSLVHSAENQLVLLEDAFTSGGQPSKSNGARRVKLAHVNQQRERPVAVSTAPFGTVMQFGNKIIIFRSDGETEVIEGEIVSWKTFPRSKNYSNQLHVIFDDRIEIYAFIHDFFVVQSEKIFGYGVKKAP